MNKDILKYGLLLILLPILQVMVFNNFDLFGYIDPYIYLIFIFIFPFKKDKTILLIISFLLGIFIDILTNSGGIHTFSLVFIVFIRAFVLQVITRKSLTELTELRNNNISLPVQFVWISVLVLIHHFILFTLEYFSFQQISTILSKTLLTSVLSILFITILLQLFTTQQKHA